MTPEQAQNRKTICSRAKVLKTKARWATVEVTRSAMCDHCSVSESCIPNLDSGKKAIAVVGNSLGAREQDLVELSITQGVLLWGTLILYLVPLIFLLAFIFAAFYLNRSLDWNKSENLVAACAGGLGLFVSLPVVRIISTRWRYLADGRPEITRILAPEEDS